MFSGLNIDSEDELGKRLETRSFRTSQPLQRRIFRRITGHMARVRKQENLSERMVNKAFVEEKTLRRAKGLTVVSFERACPTRIRPSRRAETSF